MRRGDRETQGPVLHIMFSAHVLRVPLSHPPCKVKGIENSPKELVSFRYVLTYRCTLPPVSACFSTRNRIETPNSIKIQMPPAAVGLFDRRQKSGVPASQHSPSLLRTPHAGTVRVLADRLLFLVLAGVGLYATTFHCLGQTYEAEGSDVLTPTNSAPVPCDVASL